MSELVKRQRLKDDFDFYARNCLTIRAKSAEKIKFKLNKAQLHIHKLIQAQLKETGKVRAVVLKGRQQGASTYIQGRFTWKTTHKKGVRAFILTHEDDATQNLFSMGKRYYENLPLFVKPSSSHANAKELIFDKLDSGYKVGTAGNKSVGRSQTNQFFHGSEVAFWPNAAEHAKGILQTIPDMPGTEIIYESTANGLGNFFHQQWKLAESGQSEFIAIFVPWFWQEEYKKDLPKDFSKTDLEFDLAEQYELSNEQVYFMRQKIVELSADGTNGNKAFKQELNFIPQQERHSKYAYYIHFVLSELRKKYGDDALRRGGLRIYTTLDPEVQELAENVITNGVKKISHLKFLSREFLTRKLAVLFCNRAD